jgi:hypothetical protein
MIRCNRLELFLIVTQTRLLFAAAGAWVDLLMMRRYSKKIMDFETFPEKDGCGIDPEIT